MPANFLSLPSELRNQIYELALVLDETVVCSRDPFHWHFHLERRNSNLLLANKQIHDEASSILYTQNVFDFAMCTPELVELFLDTIGPQNASHIRHIHVAFPEIRDLEVKERAIDDSSARTLSIIRQHCTNLSKLTTSIDSTDDMEIKLDKFDSPKIVNEALAMVDAHFRTVVSLQEITVQVYEDGPSDDIRRKMGSYGWMTEIIERVEVSERDFSFGGSEGSDYYDYDHDRFEDLVDDDEYDIDNDSDFWRRAAD